MSNRIMVLGELRKINKLIAQTRGVCKGLKEYLYDKSGWDDRVHFRMCEAVRSLNEINQRVAELIDKGEE